MKNLKINMISIGILSVFMFVSALGSEESLDKQFENAIQDRNVQQVKDLLRQGVDPNKKIGLRWSLNSIQPLLLVAKSDDAASVAIAEALLKAGADISNDGRSALALSLQLAQDRIGYYKIPRTNEMLKLLLKFLAEKKDKTKDFFYISGMLGDTFKRPIMSFFASDEFQPSREICDDVPLDKNLEQSIKEQIKLLLLAGVEPVTLLPNKFMEDVANELYQNTPSAAFDGDIDKNNLIKAILSKNVKRVQELIRPEIVNSVDLIGRPLLSIAASMDGSEALEIVQILIDNGANPNQLNKFSLKSPIEYGLMFDKKLNVLHQDLKMLELLFKSGSTVNIKKDILRFGRPKDRSILNEYWPDRGLLYETFLRDFEKMKLYGKQLELLMLQGASFFDNYDDLQNRKDELSAQEYFMQNLQRVEIMKNERALSFYRSILNSDSTFEPKQRADIDQILNSMLLHEKS